MKRILLVLVLGAAVAFAVWFGMRGKILTAASSAAVTALLPKETLALVQVPDFNRTREQWHETDLYKLWREPALQDFLQKPLAKMPVNASVRGNVDDVATLGMRDAFVALTAWQNDQPEFAAGFRFKGTADDAEKVIGKWRARAEANGTTRTTGDYQNHQLQLLTRGSVAIATVYDGDWFLAANSVELLKTLLDRVDGRVKDAAATLGAEENYTAAFRHMPMGYAVFAYGRLDRYFEKLATRLPDAANNPQLATLRQIKSIAGATSFENGKIRDLLFVGMPQHENATELTRASLALATKDSFLYAASLLNLPTQMTLPDPSAALAAGWAAKFQQKLAALGAKGVTLEEFESAFAPEASAVGDWPETTRIPALLASLPVKDAEKANRIVAAFTAVADEDKPWTQSAEGGVQYYTLSPENPMIPLAPTIAVTKDLLVAGLDRTSVETAMKRAGAAGAGLAETSGFKTAAALLPKPTQSFTFIDTALLYSRLDTALRPMLIMAAAFVPGVADAVDLGKLPAPEVVTKHLSPIVMSQHYQKDGYVTESIGPVSIYQAAIGVAGLSGAGAAYYQSQSGGAKAMMPGLVSPSSVQPGVPQPSPSREEEAEDSPEEPK